MTRTDRPDIADADGPGESVAAVLLGNLHFFSGRGV